jgi:hypothetical protein
LREEKVPKNKRSATVASLAEYHVRFRDFRGRRVDESLIASESNGINILTEEETE